MPKPVITAPISPRIIAQGVAFSQAIAVSNSPESITATGLPSGLTASLSGGTITISGTPLTQVQTTASITATNGDGTSDAAVIIFVVMATPPGMGGPFDIVLNYEMTTNEVTMPGLPSPAPGAPLFWAPRGTNRYLLVGVTYYGVLQDINPSDEDVTIRLGMKELEPERVIELTTGATEKVTAAVPDLQRYRIPFRVTPASWTGPLSDYETDRETMILALSELEVTVGEVASLHSATLTDSSIALEGGITSAITGDHDFTGVPEFATATPMRLTLTLSVAGRVLQTVQLVRTFDLVFTGGAFVISNLAGSTTGQGAIEGGQWRATLNLTGLTGDANSVDCDYSITTTNDTSAIYYEWLLDFDGLGGFSGNFLSPSDVITFADSVALSLYDVSSSQIGLDAGMDTNYDDLADLVAAIETLWEGITGDNDIHEIVVEDGSTLRVRVLSTTDVREVGLAVSSPTPFGPVVTPGVEGEPRTGTVTALLEQLSDPTSVPLNLTSNPILIGVRRDIVPDPA